MKLSLSIRLLKEKLYDFSDAIENSKFGKWWHRVFGIGPNGKRNPYIFLWVITVISFFIFLYFGWLSGLYAGENPRYSFFDVIIKTFTQPSLSHLFPLTNRRYDSRYAIVAFTCFAFTVFYFYIDVERNKNRLPGREKGDAKWNNFKKYNRKYVYPKGRSEISEPKEGGYDLGNMILSKNVRLNMNIRETRLNNNVLITGTTGSGKTFGYVKPNVLQFNTSYIITDPAGDIVRETGQALINHGYRLKILNLAEMRHSCAYNPFRYINSDEDVLILVKVLMKNTDDSKAGNGDPFFPKAEECFFLSLFYYIYYVYRDEPEKQNVDTLMKLMRMAKVSEKNEDAKSKLDQKFEELERRDPNNVAVLNYKTFKQGTGKTLKSILISAGVRMAPFNIPSVRSLMQKDELHLEELGDSKQALFLIIKAEDKTYNFIAAMVYTQMFQVLYRRAGMENPKSWLLQKGSCCALRSPMCRNAKQKADNKKWLEQERERYLNAKIERDNPENEKFHTEDEDGIIPYPMIRLRDENGELLKDFYSEKEFEIFMDCIKNGEIRMGNKTLASYVRCILDEFANIGEIPNFVEDLSTFRKYGISATIILQDLSQLKAMYKDNYGTVINNCATQIFLGGEDKDTSEYYSEMLGNTTIDVLNTTVQYKGNTTGSKSLNKDSAPLMRPEQIRGMDPNDCIVIVQGQDPFKDEKYDLMKHPNAIELSDYDPANEFEYRRIFNLRQLDDSSVSTRNIMIHADNTQIQKLEQEALKNNTARKPGFTNIVQSMYDSLMATGNTETANTLYETDMITAGKIGELLRQEDKEKLNKEIAEEKYQLNKDGELLMDDDPFSLLMNNVK